MSLTSIRVYPDWQARLWQSQADDKRAWRIALVLFALSILFLLSNRVTLQGPGPLLADGLVRALYLLVGLSLLARRVSFHRRWLAVACLFVLVGMVFSAPLAQRIDGGTSNRTFFLVFALFGLLLIISGWGILGLGLFRPGEERRPRWIGARILHGLVAGGVLVVLMYLSRSFVAPGGRIVLPVTPLLVQRFAYAVGMQSVAEELLFRGIMFRHLYLRRGMGFWIATCMTLPLNLSLYVVETPIDMSPLGAALRLTAACTMILVNTELYSREASVVGAIVSNAIFQISFFAMGLG